MSLFKKTFLLVLIVVVFFGISGCGLLTQIEIEEDEKLTGAVFFNTFFNDFEVLVQEFISKTYYDEPNELGTLGTRLVFPQKGDLDFSNLFSHFEIFVLNGKVHNEKEMEEIFLDKFTRFVYFIIIEYGPNEQEFNDTIIECNLEFKFFNETNPIRAKSFHSSSDLMEKAEYFQVHLVRTIKTGEEIIKEIKTTDLIITNSGEEFKVIGFNIDGVLDSLW